jgi:uncharacterized membrane protein YgcG
MRTFIVAFALVLSAAPAFAQTSSDERWTPWLGCWDLVLESSREGPPSVGNDRDFPRTKSSDDIRPQVCVERAPTGGATFRTTLGTQSAITQTLVADGSDRPLTDSDCTGTQRAEWSRSGLRLFVRAEMRCKGDPAARHVSGFAMLGPNATWTDVQAIDVAGQESYRVRRYRRAGAATAGAAGTSGAPLSLDDVKEAGGKISPHALEAVLVETHASFPLNSRRLIELADAQVPDRVIDLMVALSYPKRFVVETARVDRAPAAIVDPFGGFGYPIWADSFGFYSPFYGYYSPYYYSPFAYSYANGYNPYFYLNGGYAVIDTGGGTGGRPDRPSGAGRVVDGLGYTRVRPRETEPTTASRQGGGPIVGGDSGSSSSSSSSGSSGASSVSSGGFSSGGASSSDTGRTAQPR